MDWLQTLVSSGVVVALGLLGWRMHSSGRSQDREYTKQLVELVRTEVGHVRDDVRELRTDLVQRMVRSLGRAAERARATDVGA